MNLQNGLFYGANEGSFRPREEILLEMYQREPAPEPVFNTQLPEQHNWQFYIEYMQRQQALMQELGEDYIEHGEVTLSDTSVVNFMGDPHFGAREGDLDRLKREFDLILATPNSYVVLIGDILNNFFFNPAQFEELVQAPIQIKLFRALIDELAKYHKLLAGWEGNHDYWSCRSGNDIYNDFMQRTGAYLFFGLSYLTLHIGEADYKIAGSHAFNTAGSQYNPNHPQDKAYRFIGAWGADIVVSGHTHDKGTQIKDFVEYGGGDIRAHFINVGGGKHGDDFIRNKGMKKKGTQGMSGQSVILTKDKKRIRPYHDITEAHEDFIKLR